MQASFKLDLGITFITALGKVGVPGYIFVWNKGADSREHHRGGLGRADSLIELFNAGRDTKRLYAKMDYRFKWEHFTHITSFNLADSYSLQTPPLFQSNFSKPYSSFLLHYTTDCAQVLPNSSSYICCFILRFHLQTSCQPLTSLPFFPSLLSFSVVPLVSHMTPFLSFITPSFMRHLRDNYITLPLPSVLFIVKSKVLFLSLSLYRSSFVFLLYMHLSQSLPPNPFL